MRSLAKVRCEFSKKEDHQKTRVPRAAPGSARKSVPHPTILQRKASCTCGGHCPRCRDREELALHPKLKVSNSGDRYEREAEQVADAVMRKPEGEDPISATMAPGQGRSVESGSSREAPPIVHEVLHRPGQPLDADTRGFMESRLGHDLSGVRVHTDMKAAASAEAIGARAYTVGRHIAFGLGEYRSKTANGRRLLTHELAHVVQQTGSVVARSGVIQRQAVQSRPNEGGYCRHERSITNLEEFRIYDFDVESAELKAGHIQCLELMVLPEIEHADNPVIGLIGHASTTGPSSINKPLSSDRAWTVYRWLNQRGLPPAASLLLPVSRGSEQPVDPATPQAPGLERAEDRAVRIQVWDVQRQTDDPCEVTQSEWDQIFDRWFSYCEGLMLTKGVFDVMCAGIPVMICPVLKGAKYLSEDARKLYDACCDVSPTASDALIEKWDDCVVESVTEYVESDCSEGRIRREYEAWKQRKAEAAAQEYDVE